MSPSSSTIALAAGKMRAVVNSPNFRICASYAFSTWSERSWMFTIGLALYQVGDNLLLPAISELANCFAVLLLGAYIGAAIDKSQRLTAARASVFANNVTVILSAITLFVLFQWKPQLPSWSIHLLSALSVVLCAGSFLAQTALKIALTRDWIVVTCHGDQTRLAAMNSWLLTIDLTSALLSPLIVSQVITYASMTIGCAFGAVWSFASFPLEYCLLRLVYVAEPELAIKTEKAAVQTDAEQRKESAWKVHVVSLASGWRLYYQQTVFSAGLALGLTFLTVFDFNGISNSYAVSQGVPTNILAAVRGCSALIGIVGSVAFQALRSRIGLAKTGLIALGVEIAFLAPTVGSIWMEGSPFDPVGYFNSSSNASSSLLAQELHQSHSMLSIWVFLVGASLARFGVYMVDLTILQIMQEEVKEAERGVIFGVQNAVSKSMGMLKAVIVILLPDPKTFGIPILICFLASCLSLLFYCFYLRKARWKRTTKEDGCHRHGINFKFVEFEMTHRYKEREGALRN